MTVPRNSHLVTQCDRKFVQYESKRYEVCPECLVFNCNMFIPWDPDYTTTRPKSQNSSIPWPGIVILRNRCIGVLEEEGWPFVRADVTCYCGESSAKRWDSRRKLEACCYEYKNSSFTLRTMKNVDQTTSIINSKTCNKYADHNFCFKCCQRVNGKCFGCRSCQYRRKTCKHGILYVEALTVGI